MLFKEAVLLILRKMKYRNLGFKKCVFVLENPTFEDSLEVLILKIRELKCVKNHFKQNRI